MKRDAEKARSVVSLLRYTLCFGCIFLLNYSSSTMGDGDAARHLKKKKKKVARRKERQSVKEALMTPSTAHHTHHQNTKNKRIDVAISVRIRTGKSDSLVSFSGVLSCWFRQPNPLNCTASQ